MEDEKLEELIEKIQETKDPKLVKEFALMMGFLLHQKDYIHIILTLILNFAVTFLLVSIFPNLVAYNEVLHLSLSIVIFTVIEFFVKKIIIVKAPLLMLYTAGQVFTVINLIIYALMWAGLPGYSFNSFLVLLLFLLLFQLTRMIISLIIRKIIAKIIIGSGE